MNYAQILDAAALTVLAAQSGWIVLLYRRMGRLRVALDSAGDVIEQLDAASRRLDNSAGGIVQKVRDGIGEVDGKIQACRRVAQELTAASRQAEEVAARLDQALRQNRKLQAARAAAPPRELAEPLGLAERLAGRGAPASVLDAEVDKPLLAAPAPLSSVLLPEVPTSVEDIAEASIERLLASEMVLVPPAPVLAERRIFRLTLD
ncbi:hypothetical protein [Pseudoroseomonas ludipueritiae]|uniref:Uncharacterized protein n=1 Tax=Pseudoroseomonas ludipueritiae TaxID=198093 RepID=A0ABR7R806_9PROT|nr:hypothetical protein [Pseudoroseomonas ludipueritiae]MBC9177926.1 hypothetical protein [Pseudoroseomonas ludipueritiae]